MNDRERVVPFDLEALRALLDAHELQIDYGYEEEDCACGEWSSSPDPDAGSWINHVLDIAAAEGLT